MPSSGTLDTINRATLKLRRSHTTEIKFLLEEATHDLHKLALRCRRSRYSKLIKHHRSGACSMKVNVCVFLDQEKRQRIKGQGLLQTSTADTPLEGAFSAIPPARSCRYFSTESVDVSQQNSRQNQTVHPFRPYYNRYSPTIRCFYSRRLKSRRSSRSGDDSSVSRIVLN